MFKPEQSLYFRLELFCPYNLQYKACHHGFATQSVSAPPCRVDIERVGDTTYAKLGLSVAPSRGRCVLGIADNPEPVARPPVP